METGLGVRKTAMKYMLLYEALLLSVLVAQGCVAEDRSGISSQSIGKGGDWFPQFNFILDYDENLNISRIVESKYSFNIEIKHIDDSHETYEYENTKCALEKRIDSDGRIEWILSQSDLDSYPFIYTFSQNEDLVKITQYYGGESVSHERALHFWDGRNLEKPYTYGLGDEDPSDCQIGKIMAGEKKLELQFFDSEGDPPKRIFHYSTEREKGLEKLFVYDPELGDDVFRASIGMPAKALKGEVGLHNLAVLYPLLDPETIVYLGLRIVGVKLWDLK